MINWIITHSGGYIKNQKQANYLLLALAVLVFIISLLFIFINAGATKFNPKDYPQGIVNPEDT